MAPNNISVNNQYYSGNLKGLRKYLNSVKDENPKLFEYLNSDLKQLEHDHRISKWGGIGLYSLGGVLLLVGMNEAIKEADEIVDGKEASNDSQTYYALGLVSMLAGLGVQLVYRPDRDDLMDFINKHNKFNKESPPLWQLGINKEGAGQLLFAINF